MDKGQTVTQTAALVGCPGLKWSESIKKVSKGGTVVNRQHVLHMGSEEWATVAKLLKRLMLVLIGVRKPSASVWGAY